MDRFSVESVTIYQATWVRFIIWIILNNFALKDTVKNLIEG